MSKLTPLTGTDAFIGLTETDFAGKKEKLICQERQICTVERISPPPTNRKIECKSRYKELQCGIITFEHSVKFFSF